MSATPEKRHDIRERYSPIAVIVMCTCGWQHTESRRQNALARAQKVKAAYRKHWDDIEKQSQLGR